MITRAKLIALWLFAALVVAVAAYWAVQVGLAVAVTAGIAVGLVLRYLFEWSQVTLAKENEAGSYPKVLQWIGALILVVTGAAVALLPLLVTSIDMHAPPRSPGNYSARVSIEDDRWRVEERWAYMPDRYQTPWDTRTDRAPVLEWHEEMEGDSIVLSREREIPVHLPLFRTRSTHSYSIPWVTGRPAVGSRVIFDIPRYYAVATYPPPETHVQLINGDGLERLVINPWSAGGDGTEVRVQILNPLLRHRAGVWIVGISLLDPVKWLLLLLAAVFSGEIKKTVLTPVVKKLLLWARPKTRNVRE